MNNLLTAGYLYRFQNRDSNDLWGMCFGVGLSDADKIMYLVYVFHMDSMDVKYFLADNFSEYVNDILDKNIMINELRLTGGHP